MTRGGFWTNTSQLAYQPKAQFRFFVEVDGLGLLTDAVPNTAGDLYDPTDKLAWYASSVDKPSFFLAEKFPDGWKSTYGANYEYEVSVSATKWQPITMTFVDPSYPNLTRKLLRWMQRAGYNNSDMINNLEAFGLSEDDLLHQSVGEVTITQLDSGANLPIRVGDQSLFLERWTLVNAVPVEINFGKLDYGSEDLVEITVTWKYETCKVTVPNIEDGLQSSEPSTYFGDPDLVDKRVGGKASPRPTATGDIGRLARQQADMALKLEGSEPLTQAQNEVEDEAIDSNVQDGSVLDSELNKQLDKMDASLRSGGS